VTKRLGAMSIRHRADCVKLVKLLISIILHELLQNLYMPSKHRADNYFCRELGKHA